MPITIDSVTMQEWLMTCFKVIEIEGFAVLGWAALSWLLLHKEAVKRNTDDLMKNMLLATGKMHKENLNSISAKSK